MKKIILITIFCNCMAGMAFAQTATIKGLIVDSVKKSPLGYINITINDAAPKGFSKSLQTKDNGAFEFVAIPVNNYLVTISAVGYQTKVIVVQVNAGKPIVDLGNINLLPSSTQLKGVTVTAAKQVIKQEIDRLTYNVQADPDSKGMDVLDIMRKVPLLTVDANNNIALKGNGNYKILIDGKESALMAHNPSDILQSMPASNIESIEVITTPPAKYDAEGLAGIINIVTKKQHLQGYNVNLNGRVNNIFGPALSFNSTIQQGKLGLAIVGSDADNGHYTTAFGTKQIFFNNQSSLLQNGAHMPGGDNHYGIVQLSYEIDSLNLVTANADFFNNNTDPTSNQFSGLFSNIGALLQQYNLNTNGNSGSSVREAGINYQMGFKKSKDQLLTLSYIYNYSAFQNTLKNIFSNQFNFSQSNYQQFNNSGTKTQTVQLDYVQPVKKILQIEAGAKGIFRNNFSDFNSAVQNTANQFIIDPAQTNDFTYEQDVYSLYNSYQFKSGNWAVKAGWRLEYTNVNANFVSAANSVLNTSYHNLIPSLALQHKFKYSSVNFGFTQRIQRPGIFQLNPFVNISNPQFISIGNPNLKPELNNTFELNYTHINKNSFTTGLSYAFSNNSIQNVSTTSIQTINNKTDTTTVNTYQNLGSNRTLNYNFNTNLNISKQLSLSANGQLNYVWLQGTFNGQLYNNSGLTENAFVGPSYLFKTGYRLSFNLFYNSGRINLQGRNGYSIGSQFLFSKAFFNQKLNLFLVANNPWLRYKNTNSNTNTPDFMQTSYNQGIYRTFALRFNYKFGKLKTDLKKNKININNDDIKPGQQSTVVP